jgi:hypothetical protein
MLCQIVARRQPRLATADDYSFYTFHCFNLLWY